MKLGYHLSSEEHNAQELINLAIKAENAGFEFLTISDHFHPWVDAQGQSPFVWSTIGGISQVTKKIRIITAVTCPIERIHPVIISQAAATCAQLLPGRFHLGIGTGENLNEHVTGNAWPKIKERQERIQEAVEIIRKLWSGEYLSFEGKFFTVDEARLYSLPKILPEIYMAASGPKSAAISGQISDGLISTSPKKEIIESFESNGGKGKPKYAQVAVCFDKDEQKAKEIAFKYWPTKGLPRPDHADLKTPKEFMNASKNLNIDDATKDLAYGPNKQKHIEVLKKFFDAGFDFVAVSQIGENQDEFFEFYKNEIFPEFN